MDTVQHFRASLAREDGDQLAEFFNPRRVRQENRAQRPSAPLPEWERNCPDYLKSTLRAHWKLAFDTDLLDAVAVHDAISRVYESFIGNVFGSAFFAEWHVPILKVLARALAASAWEADAALVRRRQRPSKAKNLSQFFQNIFRIINSGGPGVKRVVLVWISNLMLQQYLRLGAIKLCEGLISSLKSMKLDLFEYPDWERVGFRYWLGRMRLIQYHFRPAAANLEEAFRHCPKTCYKARQQIFLYLALAKMVLGQAPPPRLVQKYGFSDHFSNEMLLAWKRGNFAGFQACVDDDRVWWLRKGCFNIIRERTKVIMFQNLFRSVFLIIRSQTSSQAISLNSCHVACHAAGLTDFTLADVENTVANLIELGLLRGYLHHDRRIIVVKSGAPIDAVLPGPSKATIDLSASEYDIPL